MKRTKIFAGFAALVFMAGLGFVSCSNDDDEDEKELSIEDTKDNSVSSESIAFNILRDLCDLANEDGEEELPDGWESKTFSADIGTTFPEEIQSDSTVRYVAVESADEAASYFHELIGSESDSWADSKAGTFTFEKADSAEDADLLATLTVESDRIKNLSVLNFYSAEGIKSSVGENGVTPTYYHAGDIVSRNSDGTVWMCVKPAGGPSNEKNSYWMCLDPFAKSGKKAGKCIIKEDKRQVMLSQGELIQKNWVYAKNLMSLDTAKAAYHTFNALLNGNGTNASAVYNSIKGMGYDIANLSNNGENFCFAYGSPKNDKEVRVSRKSRENPKPVNSQTTYVQPFFIGKVGAEDSVETTSENYNTTTSGAKSMLAVTDAYDINYLDSFFTNFYCYILRMKDDPNDGYTYLDYIHAVDEDGSLRFKGDFTWMNKTDRDLSNLPYDVREKFEAEIPSLKSYPYHIIFSPELTIKDNGTADSDGFTDIYHSGDDNSFDYWDSL